MLRSAEEYQMEYRSDRRQRNAAFRDLRRVSSSCSLCAVSSRSRAMAVTAYLRVHGNLRRPIEGAPAALRG